MTTTSPPPSGAEKARLLRRAQAVARLRHPNLVRLLPLPGGAGLAPVLGNARRLADFTLPAGTFKRFDLEQVVRLLLDVLSGLAALHEVVTDEQAFVHGDVSPQNIYIDEHGTARLVPILNAHLTNAAKPEENGYAAPERLLGDRVDARADVFSVGVMLWEALAGKRLFPDASVEGVMARSLGRRLPPIRLAPDTRWAQPLCSIAERAIAADPALRHASALELSNAVAAAAAQQLSRVDTDAWQEEAPTPVFQPRLHLATLRASTPPPAVLTIPASVGPSSDETVPPQVETVPPDLEASIESFQVRGQRRRGRSAFVVGVMVALVALGVGFVKAPHRAPSVAAAAELAPVTPLPDAVPAPLLAVPSLSASAVPVAAAVSIASASPVASVSTVAPSRALSAVSASPAVAFPAVKKPAGAVKPRTTPSAHAEDYGI